MNHKTATTPGFEVPQSGSLNQEIGEVFESHKERLIVRGLGHKGPTMLSLQEINSPVRFCKRTSSKRLDLSKVCKQDTQTFHLIDDLNKGNAQAVSQAEFGVNDNPKVPVNEVSSQLSQKEPTVDEFGREELFDKLRELDDKPQDAQEGICNRAFEIFDEVGIDSLEPTELVSAKFAAEQFIRLNDLRRAAKLNHAINETLEQIENHPLVSQRSDAGLDEPISVEEAVKTLQRREDNLRSTSNEAFGMVNDETIEEMQRAYLKLIWDDIEW